MAKKIQVKNLAQLEKAVKGLIHDNMFFTSNLQEKSAEIMSDRIKENVYEAFDPKEYKRDGDDGGFSDPSGIIFTDVKDVGNGIAFTLENMNGGGDSMSGKTLTEMFETGDKNSWNNPYVTDDRGRVVSDARPFIEDSIEDMEKNKGELYDSLRKDLRNIGLRVK